MGAEQLQGGHMARCCPFCDAPVVDRLWLASPALDSCECRSCWARWEEAADGTYRGRVSSAGGWSSVSIRW